MSHKHHKNKAAEPWTQWFTDRERFQTMTWRMLVYVEAAGSIGRAQRLGAFDGLEPEALEIVWQMVPPSRGGACAAADAEMIWGRLMMDVMQAEQGREAVAKAREFFDKRERDLANESAGETEVSSDRARIGDVENELRNEVSSE